MQSIPAGESTRPRGDAVGVADENSEQPEGLRERKKRQRSQALRQAAIELTLENGYTNVTVEDICERCGVSRRTFFNYFKSKEEALLGRADTVFDDEDQPAIEEFEAGGPTGRLLSDLHELLAEVVRTRLNKREEMHAYHQILKADPSLMQVQMSRMGNNERLFREMIQRRLDADAGEPTPGAEPASGVKPSPGAEPASEVKPRAASAKESVKASAHESATADDCHTDEGIPVSPKAEALAALAMMAIKATFMRLRRVEGDPALVIRELFDELTEIFAEESA